jgi:hypothetical protein
MEKNQMDSTLVDTFQNLMNHFLNSAIRYTNDANLLSANGETYTIIVGFVVIGIPLALQNVKNDADNYNSKILVNRFTSGRIVSPLTLVILAVIYIILSFSAKGFPKENIYFPYINLILFCLFLITTVLSGYFYIRFYKRVTTSSESYISCLLNIPPLKPVSKTPKLFSIELNSIYEKIESKLEQINSKDITKKLYVLFLNQILSILKATINRKELNIKLRQTKPRKYTKKQIDKHSAGLELLLNKFKNKNYSEQFFKLYFEYFHNLKSSTFGVFKNKKKILSNSEILLLSVLWSSLIQVLKAARVNQDSMLSFRSQRALAELISEFVHHPQVSKIIAESSPIDQDTRINLGQDIYEIARWQSQQTTDGIDLILECEWMDKLCSLLTECSFDNDTNYVLSCFKTYQNIVELNCKKHPEKILPTYKNLADSLPFVDHVYDYQYNLPKETRWLFDYWHDFQDTKFYLNETQKINEHLETLINGKAYIKHGEYGVSRPLSQEEYKQTLVHFKRDKLYKQAYLYQCEYSILVMIGYIAFYKRWQELEECLYWRQPLGTNVNYCGEAILPESEASLENLISNYFSKINGLMFFVERHEAINYIFKGLCAVLVFLNKSKESIVLFSNSNQTNIKENIEILGHLKKQITNIKNENYLNDESINTVQKSIDNSLIALQERSLNFQKDRKINSEEKSQFRDQLFSGFENKENPYKLNNLFKVSFTKNILPNQAKLIKSDTPKDHITYSEHIGTQAHTPLFNHVYQFLTKSATKTVFNKLNSQDNIIIFANSETLINYGFIKERNDIIRKHAQNINWKGVVVNNDKSLCVHTEDIEISLTKNVTFLGNCPLFAVINDDKSSLQVKIIIDAYFDIEILNDHSTELIE